MRAIFIVVRKKYRPTKNSGGAEPKNGEGIEQKLMGLKPLCPIASATTDAGSQFIGCVCFQSDWVGRSARD